MAITGLNRPIFDIIGDAAQNLTNLVRAESRLARAEVAENIGRAGAGIGMMAFGGIRRLVPGPKRCGRKRSQLDG